MVFKEQVDKLLKEALLERPYLFLIDFKIDSSNKINIILDGDQGVTLQDCIDVSRHVEHNLDREENDFALEVASAGLSMPLRMPRQFVKNVGRKLKIKTVQDQEFEAEVMEANEEVVKLYWKAREPKKIGKGKETVEKNVTLPYSDIKEATVVVSF